MKDKLNIGQTVGTNRVTRKMDERYISPQGKRMVQWELECTKCGTRKVSTTSNITSGKSSSCACQFSNEKNTRKRTASITKDGCGAREVYRDYQRGAEKRGIEFNLTLTEAEKMFKSDCYYCGDPPTMTKARKAGDYLYNGIDRVDNHKIYTPNTTVPCCKTCNRIKHILPEQEFIQHIKKIIKHHG
jgi:hypothetical protein